MKDCYMVTLDTSTNKTGVCVFKNGKYDGHFLIDKSNIKDTPERIKEMSKAILGILQRINPQIIYIEEDATIRNAKTFRMLMLIQGVAYTWSICNDCEFNVVRPSEWRKPLGINGGKREELKAKSINYIKDTFNLKVTDDEADAICIGCSVMKRFEKMK